MVQTPRVQKPEPPRKDTLGVKMWLAWWALAHIWLASCAHSLLPDLGPGPRGQWAAWPYCPTLSAPGDQTGGPALSMPFALPTQCFYCCSMGPLEATVRSGHPCWQLGGAARDHQVTSTQEPCLTLG